MFTAWRIELEPSCENNMDVEGLLRHFGIPYTTSDRSHNVGRRWVGLRCPFCGDQSDHLGINADTGACKCWRCGGKPLRTVLVKLTGLSDRHVNEALTKYGATSRRKVRAPEAEVRTSAFKLPSGTDALGARHKRYLQRRGFDPDYLEQLWGLGGTGVVSFLDGINFSHRIVAPVYWGDRLVSFQARDITDRAELRYITCPAKRERVHHKHILYGLQDYWNPDAGICVEGITDVWRLGPSAAATFGTTVTLAQVRVLARWFRRIAVVFDGGEQAAGESADELVGRLRACMVDAWRVDIAGDPGGLSDDDARALVREVGAARAHGTQA